MSNPYDLSAVSFSNVEDFAKKVSEQQEQIILKQLSWFVKRGILVIESSQPIITRDHTGELHVSQAVNLVLKDKEHIEKLELDNDRLIGENKKLKEMIQQMVNVTQVKG